MILVLRNWRVDDDDTGSWVEWKPYHAYPKWTLTKMKIEQGRVCNKTRSLTTYPVRVKIRNCLVGGVGKEKCKEEQLLFICSHPKQTFPLDSTEFVILQSHLI